MCDYLGTLKFESNSSAISLLHGYVFYNNSNSVCRLNLLIQYLPIVHFNNVILAHIVLRPILCVAQGNNVAFERGRLPLFHTASHCFTPPPIVSHRLPLFQTASHCFTPPPTVSHRHHCFTPPPIVSHSLPLFHTASHCFTPPPLFHTASHCFTPPPLFHTASHCFTQPPTVSHSLPLFHTATTVSHSLPLFHTATTVSHRPTDYPGVVILPIPYVFDFIFKSIIFFRAKRTRELQHRWNNLKHYSDTIFTFDIACLLDMFETFGSTRCYRKWVGKEMTRSYFIFDDYIVLK